MDCQNARLSYFGRVWPGQHLVSFRREMPKATEWDQLLAKLALDDSQALEAVKSDGEEGEQLRKFVLRFFQHYFVPEAAIKAVRRRRKVKHVAISLASQPTAIDSNAVATISGEQV
jgi:hypothetical protein